MFQTLRKARCDVSEAMLAFLLTHYVVRQLTENIFKSLCAFRILFLLLEEKNSPRLISTAYETISR